jgi:hypothetical protein
VKADNPSVFYSVILSFVVYMVLDAAGLQPALLDKAEVKLIRAEV